MWYLFLDARSLLLLFFFISKETYCKEKHKCLNPRNNVFTWKNGYWEDQELSFFRLLGIFQIFSLKLKSNQQVICALFFFNELKSATWQCNLNSSEISYFMSPKLINTEQCWSFVGSVELEGSWTESSCTNFSELLRRCFILWTG